MTSPGSQLQERSSHFPESISSSGTFSKTLETENVFEGLELFFYVFVRAKAYILSIKLEADQIGASVC
jgi:hypothetical protein